MQNQQLTFHDELGQIFYITIENERIRLFGNSTYIGEIQDKKIIWDKQLKPKDKIFLDRFMKIIIFS